MDIGLLMFIAVYTAVIIIVVCSGIPVAFGMGLFALLILGIFVGWDMLEMIPYVAWSSATSFALTTIFPFVLMGTVFAQSGLANSVYSSIEPLVSRFLPGGLLHTNILGGALFASVSGSNIASTTTLGLFSLSEMERRGYERGISIGSVIAGGSLGTLIPPSIIMIIYGALTGVSIGKLFVGGIIPGIILTAGYASYIIIRLKINPNLAPPKEPQPLKACLVRSISSFPVFLLAFFVIGSIYFGVAAPTEAGSMGCIGVVIIAASFRKLNWMVIKKATWDGINVIGMLGLLFVLTKVMGSGLVLLHIPDRVMDMVVTLGISKYYIWGAVVLMYFFMGMIMNAVLLIIITIYITFPLMVGVGFDPVWYGIFIILLQEMANITPPVGLLLFIMQGLRPDYQFTEIVKGSLPFVLVIFLVLVLLTVFPKLATFLPEVMF